MFLASLPPKTRGQILVSQKILQPKSKETEEVTVTYSKCFLSSRNSVTNPICNTEDGKTISIDPKTIGTTFDMQQTFDQYSRSLKIQEDINDV